MLIVIEGIDGSGKTFISMKLAKNLECQGYKVFLTKEPTEGPIGNLIKNLMNTEHKIDEFWGKIMALLFAADRYYHQIEILKKEKEGYIVISDRYYHSTFAYQLSYPNIDIKWVMEMHKYIKKPDYVFVLDVPVDVALERIKQRKTTINVFENRKFLERSREIYMKLKDILPEENIYYLDNTKDPDMVVEEIIKILGL